MIENEFLKDIRATKEFELGPVEVNLVTAKSVR